MAILASLGDARKLRGRAREDRDTRYEIRDLPFDAFGRGAAVGRVADRAEITSITPIRMKRRVE